MTPQEAIRIVKQQFGLDATLTTQALPCDVIVSTPEGRFAVVDNGARHRIEQFEESEQWMYADADCNTATVFTDAEKFSLENAVTVSSSVFLDAFMED